MKVIVCGDRNWTNKEAIKRELSEFPPCTEVIHGGCRGADTLAGDAARELGFNVRVVVAQWNLHGRAAGPIRNQKMLDNNPHYVLAFHADIENSKGTKHMVSIATKSGTPVLVYKE